MRKTERNTSKFTVIIAANSIWNLQNFRLPILKMLKEKGAKVIALAPSVLDKNIERSLPVDEFIGLKHCSPDSSRVWRNVQLYREFKQIFKETKPDLVLLYTIKPNIFGNLAAKSLKIPVVSTVTGLGYTFLRGNWLRPLTKYLYQFAFTNTSKVVFHNPDDLRLFVHEKTIKAEQGIVIKGSGVDLKKFSLSHDFKTTKKEGLKLLFVGRLLVDKGIVEYLKAAKILEKELPNTWFNILGGHYPENPASISQREWQYALLQKNIIWYNWQSDVRPFLQEADVIVLPSYREGLPMSILEAMALEKPIITTDVPGCRETVEDGKNGFLVDVKNPQSLVDAIKKVSALSPLELKEMGSASRSKVEREFSSLKVVEAYEKLVDELVKNKNEQRKSTIIF